MIDFGTPRGAGAPRGEARAPVVGPTSIRPAGIAFLPEEGLANLREEGLRDVRGTPRPREAAP
ncbi:hypothetical protein BURK1_00557 [Burkholderiales bacterium]|nr:hypothetical protein BURK1_00557 [Burkholderiales bacterium]